MESNSNNNNNNSKSTMSSNLSLVSQEENDAIENTYYVQNAINRSGAVVFPRHIVYNRTVNEYAKKTVVSYYCAIIGKHLHMLPDDMIKKYLLTVRKLIEQSRLIYKTSRRYKKNGSTKHRK